MKPKFLDFYMSVAQQCAGMSTAKRLQVGSVVVKDNNIISFSWNGTPAGWDNNCEDLEVTFDVRDTCYNSEWCYDINTKQYSRLKTKPEVLHAERNALDKLARGHQSGLGATMFVTHAPCMECAKSIYGVGIAAVYYQNDYRSTDGIEFLKKCGIPVSKYVGSETDDRDLEQ